MCMICETARRARQRQEAERAREEQLRQHLLQLPRGVALTVLPMVRRGDACNAAT